MSDQPKHGPPHGMEKHDLGGINDLGALSQAQQADLNQFKKYHISKFERRNECIRDIIETKKLAFFMFIKTRIGNEKYLREHPEVECLIAGFLSDVLNKRPESIREFAAEYFTNPTLPEKVEKQLASRLEKLKQNRVIQSLT